MQRSSALHNPDFREGKTTRKKEPQNTADFIKNHLNNQWLNRSQILHINLVTRTLYTAVTAPGLLVAESYQGLWRSGSMRKYPLYVLVK